MRVEVTPRALELTETIWGPIGAEGIEQLRQMTRRPARSWEPALSAAAPEYRPAPNP